MLCRPHLSVSMISMLNTNRTMTKTAVNEVLRLGDNLQMQHTVNCLIMAPLDMNMKCSETVDFQRDLNIRGFWRMILWKTIKNGAKVKLQMVKWCVFYTRRELSFQDQSRQIQPEAKVGLELCPTACKSNTKTTAPQHLLETLNNKYMLLTKHKVKMAGYWPSSRFAFLWTKMKSWP